MGKRGPARKEGYCPALAARDSLRSSRAKQLAQKLQAEINAETLEPFLPPKPTVLTASAESETLAKELRDPDDAFIHAEERRKQLAQQLQAKAICFRGPYFTPQFESDRLAEKRFCFYPGKRIIAGCRYQHFSTIAEKSGIAFPRQQSIGREIKSYGQPH
jgi:hypothetical protein